MSSTDGLLRVHVLQVVRSLECPFDRPMASWYISTLWSLHTLSGHDFLELLYMLTVISEFSYNSLQNPHFSLFSSNVWDRKSKVYDAATPKGADARMSEKREHKCVFLLKLSSKTTERLVVSPLEGLMPYWSLLQGRPHTHLRAFHILHYFWYIFCVAAWAHHTCRTATSLPEGEYAVCASCAFYFC